MNTRLLLNLGLLALVAVLGLFAYFQPGLEKPSAPPALTDLAISAIDRIRIEDRDGKTVALAREGGQWRLMEPVQLPANAVRVEALLHLAEESSYGQLDATDLDLAEFGLDAPRVRLLLNDRALVFGTTEPLDGRRYVRDGDTVHLIADRYFHILTGGFTEFVNQQLLPQDARVVELATPDWRLTRSAEGKWTLDPAPPGRSADTPNLLIDRWLTAQAVWVQPYEQAEAKGQIVVRLEGAEQPLRFDILAREPELVLARPDIGVQYHLAEDTARSLLEINEATAAPEQDDVENVVPQNPD